MKQYKVDSKALPSWQREKLAKLRVDITGALQSTQEGVLAAADFVGLCHRVVAATPNVWPGDAIRATLSYFTCFPFVRDDIAFYARRLSGAGRCFTRGRLVTLRKLSAAVSWNMARIANIDRINTKHGPKLMVNALCFVGPWSGEEVSFMISKEFAYYYSAHHGFSRRDPDLRLTSVLDMLGLFTCVKVSRAVWHDRVEATGFVDRTTIRSVNRKIIRDRVAGCSKCTKKENGRCLVGWDNCWLARNQFAWYNAECSECHNIRPINPRYESCLACHMQSLKRRR